MTVLGSAEVQLDLDTRNAALKAERSLSKSLRSVGERLGRNLGDGVNDGVQRVQITSLAQKIRDARTLYDTSLGPIKKYSDETQRLAVRAGAASAAIGAGTGLGGALLAAAGPLASIGAAAPVAVAGFVALQAASLAAKVGLAGVGDALDAKIGDAFEKLSPQATKFVGEFGRMVPALASAKRAIQDSLFANLSKDIRPLAERYLPSLTQHGREFAGIFNTTLRQAVREALNPETVKAFNQTLDAGVDVVGSIGSSLTGLVPTLAKVVAAGAPAFRSLGDSIAGGLTSLQEKLRAGLKSGAVQDFIAGGVQAAKDLFGVLGNVAGILLKVQQAAQAAFGNNILGLVRDVTGGVKEFLSSAQGQDTLVSLFRDFKPVLSGVGDVIQTLLPQVQDLLPVVADLGVAFTDGLIPVIPVAGKLAQTLGSALADVLPAVSDLAVAVGTALTGALEAVAPVIPPLATALTDLLSPTGAFQSFVEAVGPILPTVAEGLAAIVSGAGTGLSALFDAIGPSLPAVADGFGKLAAALGKGIADSLGKIASSGAMGSIADALVTLSGAIADLAVDTLETLADVLVDLAPVLPDAAVAVGQLAAALSELIPAVGFVGELATAVFRLGEAAGKLEGSIFFEPARITQTSDGYAKFGEKLQGVLEKLPGLQNLATALGNINDAAPGGDGKFIDSLEAVGPKLERTAEATAAVAAGQREHEAETALATAAINDQVSAAQSLGDILDTLAGKFVDSTRADIAARDAKDRLSKALKENGKNFNLNTPAGRANTEALLNARDAALRYAEAQEKLNPGVGRGTAAFKTYVAQLNAMLRAAGVSEAAIAKFNKEILATPPSPKVTPKVDTKTAQDQLDRLAEQRQAPIEATSSTSAAEAKLNETARRRTSDVTAAAATASAEQRLNDAARNRQARITAQVFSAAAADARLNEIARNRYATIYAKASLGDAERQINDAARDRYATIHVTTTGSIGNILPGRMAGGPIVAGQPYLVGEAGPEIVVPKQAGTVIPNDKAFGNGTPFATAVNGPVELGPRTIAALSRAFAQARGDVRLGREKVGDVVSQTIGSRAYTGGRA